VSEQQKVIHHRACHLCEAICGLLIETQGDQIISIKGDPDDPLSRGHICPKAVALQDIHSDPDRLRSPVKRVRRDDGSDDFVPILWSEALDTVASALVKAVQANGVDSVGVYLGNPTVHNYGMMTHQGSLFRHLRTRNRFSATSVDQLPHHLVSLWLFGHKLLFPIPDIDRTDYFLMLGANPIASNGSIWTVPDVRKRIKSLTARGGKLVVVDPRRTETASLSSDYIAIKPGSDAWLLLAIIRTIVVKGWVRLRNLQDFVVGLDAIESAVERFTPEVASEKTGISAEHIEQVAYDFAHADAAICYGRMGVSTQRYGALCQWAIQVLNILTGNLDREGGSMFTLPAVDQVENTSPGGFGRHSSRVSQLPEFDRELPASVLAEEITTEGEGQIRVLFTGAGNPVLSTPSGHKLDDALEQLDFMVSLDPWINETTRHADIILPPTSPLEHDHYDLAFHVNAMRNTARYNPPVFEKAEHALHDWEIFEALGQRVAEGLGLDSKPSPAPEVIIDFGLKAGPYGQASAEQLDLAVLKSNPSGVDLGPLKPLLPGRLKTPGQQIDLAVPAVLHDLERLLNDTDSDAPYSLIGRRHVRDCNSWMHNFRRLVKGKDRCTLMVNPVDAEREGWCAGDDVQIASSAGSVRAKVEVSDEIMAGVVSLPHGYGHNRNGTKMTIANDHAGVSCNDVTDARYFDALSGNAAINGVPVHVTAAES
jgi:anaerobic selenocysteine-containing dehydrogenase